MRNSRVLATILVLVTLACAARAQDEASTCRLTIVYDNYRVSPGQTSDWGFSCFIEGYEQSILFDTGASGSVLVSNLQQSSIAVSSIDSVVLSHGHNDHAGGLFSLAGAGSAVDIYCTSASRRSLSGTLPSRMTLIEVSETHEICSGVWTTGEFRGSIIEHALVLQTVQGLVVMTGCAHPGIVRIIEAVVSIFPEEPIHLLIGGFHLLDNSVSSQRSIAGQLRDLGVEQVAPTHCSGTMARIVFAEIFRDGYLEAGVGWTLELPL